MHFHSNTVLAFLPTIFLNRICGYLLIAANLDDIRDVAKKFVSENLAEELVKAASVSILKNDKVTTKTRNPNTNRKHRAYAAVEPRIRSPGELPSQINLDAIVEKVKERLVSEYGDVKEIFKKTKKRDQGIVVKREKTAETGRNVYPYSPPAQVVTPGYVKPQVKNEEVKEIYDGAREGTYGEIEVIETHLKWNESYEDYAEPKKDKYYSETTKRYKAEKILKSDSELVKNMKDKIRTLKENEGIIDDSVETLVKKPIAETRFVKVKNRDSDRLKHKNVKPTTKQTYNDYDETEIEARTENIGYDDKVLIEETIKKRGKPTKATRIPKRDFYKLSSPDYYKQLPNVAEKYDFNEPLPERDREHESYKPFPNPPARINKRIRLA